MIQEILSLDVLRVMQDVQYPHVPNSKVYPGHGPSVLNKGRAKAIWGCPLKLGTNDYIVPLK